MQKVISRLKLPHNTAPLIIALIYLVISVLWIIFSDQIVAALVTEPERISALQTLKGLGFVSATTLLLYILVRSPLKKMFQINQRLSQAEEKLRLMFESLTSGVVVVSLDNKIADLNPALLRMSGSKQKEDLLGKDLFDFFDRDTQEAILADLIRTQKNGVSGIVERNLIRLDGSVFPATLSTSLLKDSSGIPTGLITIIEDITQRKAVESRAAHLHQVLSLVRDVNQLIVHEEDEHTLLAKACQGTIDGADYQLAWIALADVDGHLRPAVYAGEKVDLDVCLNSLGRELVTDVEPVVKNKCANGRFAAAISLPLTVHDKVMGAFTVCSMNPKAFSFEEEYNLMVEVSQDLSLGIEKIRKRAETVRTLEELARRNEFIETVTDNLPIGLAVNSPSQPFQYMNRNFEEIYGWPKEVIANVEEFFDHVYPDPEYRRFIKQKVMGDIESGDPKRMVWEDIPVTHQNGDRHYISAVNIPLPEQDLVISTVWDVTKRHEAEQQLVLRARLLDASMDSIYVADPQTKKFLYFNEQAHKLLGYTREEFSGMSLADIIPPERGGKLGETIRDLMGKGEAVFESLHLHKDGHWVPVEIHAQVIDIDARLYMMGLTRDITERKAMQEKLILTDRLASIGELAAGIAHEINNPLTGILGFAELLRERTLPNDIREDVDTIYNEARRTAEVVKNMLTFARKHEPYKRLIQINETINDTLKFRSHDHHTSNIEVIPRLDPDLPEVNADPIQMQQVFLNIILNAEYAMKEAHNGGTLTVTSKQSDGMIRISIADDGTGITTENQKHLFDPFFTTKPEGKGTGLGLSICHGIVTNHNGKVWVESELGKGTAFLIELPVPS